MAMAKMGTGIIEINGRFGGNVFRTDVCGQHIQATPRHVNRNPSDAQFLRRKAFSRAKRAWSKWWTPEFASRWRTYAQSNPMINKKGETYIPTDGQIFMRINIIRSFNDVPMLQYPP